MHLSKFKEGGLVKFERTLCIPQSERIPALAQTDEGHFNVLTAIVGSIKSALDNINLRKGLNEDQVIEIAEVLIDEASEDQLALEDVLLFLQRLSTGKAGTLYDRLDMPTFFELFESYREERFQALKHVRYEQEVRYKSMGDTNRYSERVDEADSNYRQELSKHYKNLYNEAPPSKPDPPQG